MINKHPLMQKDHSLTRMITVSLVHCLLLSMVIAASNISTDQQSLLALKDHITYDPSNVLAQNWTSNTSVCSWIGITCDANSHRVTVLNISNFNLQGTIPTQLANLSSLQTLNLSHNRLLGNIPSSIFTISTLKFLDLEDNQLSGSVSSFIFNMSSLLAIDLSFNRLSGEIPPNICHYLHHLEILFLDNNMFHGKIPSTLSMCKQLQQLSLDYSNISGTIPKEIGNLTKLEEIHLSGNLLHGEIPHEIGNLPSLEILGLSNNILVGEVPATIFNMSAAKKISLSINSLSGILSSRINLALPNVNFLNLRGNNFTGTIPSFITNASKLTALDLGVNSFSGFIPGSVGNLRNLEFLGLRNNDLSSTPILSFLSSLENCKKLRFLNLESNPLNGILPSSIGNLSISLEKLYLTNCNIKGNIPKVISNASGLILLELGYNKLTGSIPATLKELLKLQALALQNNKLEGSIPEDLCHLARLFLLSLGGNKLSGSIPSCLGNLTSLRSLLLGFNEFTSVIPSTFWNLKDILVVNISSNSLDGPLSSDIGNLKVVQAIDLSMNNLSGDIPGTIGALTNLQVISLAYNRLEGPIPKSFGDLTSLVSLNLSYNKISGSIPTTLEKLLYLKELNLSFNKLEGEIPKGGLFVNFSTKSFFGNDLLCGSPDLKVPRCKNSTGQKSKKSKLLLEIVLPGSIVLIIVIILALKWKQMGLGKRSTRISSDVIMSPLAMIRRYSYRELWRATDGFGENNLIGIGSFGSVYRAQLQDGMQVAVKVFQQQCERALNINFETECEVMKSIRHRNLVKIISSCSSGNFKALVLEYMHNGSLEDWLYSNTCILDIFQRVNILIDVASALEYLHFNLLSPVIHCDIKPGNILLDENMVAHLSDFGIAKLLTREDRSMAQTQTLATIGYMPPEYGIEGRVSTRSDVYSYEIMLMETFTKKKPTDKMFIGELSLKCWVNDLLPLSFMKVVDTNLLREEEKCFATKKQCVLSILSLAMECTTESPEKRINVREIVTTLLKIRDRLVKSVER